MSQIAIRTGAGRPLQITKVNTSVYLQIPLALEGKENALYGEAAAVQDIYLMIYRDDYTASVQLGCSTYSSMTLPDLELRTKLLRKLVAKARRNGVELANHQMRPDTTVAIELTSALQALGIRNTSHYDYVSGKTNTVPVAGAIKKIAEAMENEWQKV